MIKQTSTTQIFSSLSGVCLTTVTTIHYETDDGSSGVLELMSTLVSYKHCFSQHQCKANAILTSIFFCHRAYKKHLTLLYKL